MSAFAKLSLDVDAEKLAEVNDLKSGEVVEVDSSKLESQSRSQLESISQLSYRPQRTESPRVIKINGFEERVKRV